MTKTEAYDLWIDEIIAEPDTNCAINAGDDKELGCYWIEYFGGEHDGKRSGLKYDRRTKLK